MFECLKLYSTGTVGGFNLAGVASGQMSVFFVLCVYVNCFLVLNPVWSISYHSLCPELYHFNYIRVWKCGLCYQSCGSCLHAFCWCCRWWSLPGTTTSATPGGRTSWGLWPKTAILVTCSVSFRLSHILFHVQEMSIWSRRNCCKIILRLERCLKRGTIKRIICTFLIKHEHLSQLLYILLFVNSSDTN